MAVLGKTMLNDVLWADAEFESLVADYSDVVLEIEESNGNRRRIRCHGYIGYRAPAFWDEVVVESATVSSGHPMVRESADALDKRLGEKRPPSGEEARNSGDYQALEVRFLDGGTIVVVASGFSTEPTA